MDEIPCPFIFKTGKRCAGHVARIEAYKADVVWERVKDGRWGFFFSPRSHFHLFCSEKDNHAGFRRPDDARMKFYRDELPEEVRAVIGATGVAVAPAAGPAGS